MRRYVKAVASTVGAEHGQWEELRDQLQLSPDELLVRIETMTEACVSLSRPIHSLAPTSSRPRSLSAGGAEGGDGEEGHVTTSGTLYITDRNIYFAGKGEVVIVPLHVVDHTAIEMCSDEDHGKRLGMKKAGHSLRIPCAEIR